MSQGQKELRTHSSEYIPFSYYKSRIPDSFPNVPLHWHTEFELNYILSGQGEFICGDEHFISKAGDILFIMPNVLHSFSPYQDNVQCYDTFVFHPSMFSTAQADRSSLEFFNPLAANRLTISPLITSSSDEYPIIQDCVKKIFIAVKENTALSDIRLKSELYRLFATLIESGNIKPANHQQEKIELIRPALEYIYAHSTENLSIPQLAELSHLSESYFMGCFKKSVGVGAIEYINQLRIKNICEKLLSTDESISEIAFNCGFTNLANFNRQFLKQIGISPKEYRKRN